jgi:integrase-like protein/Arm domain-containing DNA-binding protein
MLTAKKVERAKPGRYHDGHGLYLQVVNPANKSWLLRFERNGRERWYGLGPAHTFSLKEASERACAARQLLHDGIDPIDHRKAQRAARALEAAKAITFRDCAEAYIAANRDAWKNAKHSAQWTSTLKSYVFPHIGNLPVANIDTGLVLKCIEPHWQAKTETMSRVRGRIESILDWATVRKYRSGDNPARWTGHLEHVLPIRRAAGLYGGAAPARRHRGARPRVHHPYRSAYRRSDRRQMGRDRSRCRAVDRASRAHEGGQGAHRAVEQARRRATARATDREKKPTHLHRSD